MLTKRKKKHAKWDDSFYVKAYRLAKSGMTDTAIANTLGVSPAAIVKFKAKRPAFAEALESARKEDGENFLDYVYKRLPDEVKEVWDEIQKCDKEKNGMKRLEATLERAGMRTRQHLYLHALVHCNFNPSEACRKVCISDSTLRKWIRNEPGFGAILDSMHYHKGNFFEGHLINLVKHGDSAATIYANKTFNRDRGYGEKVQIENTHNIAVVSVDEMNLDLETRRKILSAMKAGKQPELPPHIQDAEFSVKESRHGNAAE